MPSAFPDVTSSLRQTYSPPSRSLPAPSLYSPVALSKTASVRIFDWICVVYTYIPSAVSCMLWTCILDTT
ncbi:hypothetical protein LshimejAT787_0204480 [Lyophyllum shimeji]|uniref:Uncharacterized protein n=1 Tax=Lyophyllum shimeji TaxID=47721 RepID=A0A9P3UIT9_LYOSH|nr:hypothetical protein LshimejAT787_0204480 [Lyophyllum shimeji]